MVFFAGTFNGPDLSTTKEYAANFSAAGARPHLAMVPSHMAVRIANASTFACGIDLKRGMYIRRSVVEQSALQIEQRWYAHRTRKSVLVMEIELLPSHGLNTTSGTTVGLELHSIGDFMTNVDVNWAKVIDSPTATMWSRDGSTKQAEDGTIPGNISIAFVNTPVLPTLTLQPSSPAYFFGVGESSIMNARESTSVKPLQRATATWESLTAMDSASQAQLAVDHARSWAQLWELATIELDTNRVDIRRAVNATLYGMLSLHDETDTTSFPGSPLDGITLGSFGHWGGCYLWDADMWM
eukprot:SAG31_NODE_393_length_16293_cov_15.804372_5_plen_297_part_00